MKNNPSLPIGLAVVLWFLSQAAYESLTPGIPDSNILPIVAVPLAFPLYGSVCLWSSFDMLVVWGLSCLVFLLPQVTAFAAATTRRAVVSLGIATFAEWLLCVWRLRSLSYSDYGYRFGYAAVTLAALLGIGAVCGRLYKLARDKRGNA